MPVASSLSLHPSFVLGPLPASSVVFFSESVWPVIIAELRSQVHAADLWVPDETRKPLTVAEVKSLRAFAGRSPVGAHKLAVVPGADRLSQESANALLKTLEEPPAGVFILLLAESARLLPTVRSRVTTLAVAPEFARMNEEQASDSSLGVWKRALAAYDVQDSWHRQEAQRLLYLYPLVHQGIKPETIVDNLPPQ